MRTPSRLAAHQRKVSLEAFWPGTLAATAGVLLWCGRPLHAIISRTADRCIRYHTALAAANYWNGDARPKNSKELSPSESAGSGRRRVTIHIKDIYEIPTMFGISALKPAISGAVRYGRARARKRHPHSI